VSAKSKILSEFELFRGNGGGIEAWFTESMPDTVVDVLANCQTRPISCEVLGLNYYALAYGLIGIFAYYRDI
jgi:hypothetical protein